MIPTQNIVAWGNVVPWADQRQVEQDLIISRALIEIFSDAMLRDDDVSKDDGDEEETAAAWKPMPVPCPCHCRCRCPCPGTRAVTFPRPVAAAASMLTSSPRSPFWHS